MATVSNAFDALASKSKKPSKTSSSTDENQPQNETQIELSEPTSNDESSWTVQSSTKRRLAPQYVLSKNDLGVDSPKNKASQQEIAKKKVTRFTKEEILALRVETKVLPSLVELSDIISVECFPPVCLQPFDFEDFNRIWNADRASNVPKDVIGPGGRGRGRSKRSDENGDSEGGYYQGNRNRDDDLWDSSNNISSKAVNTGFDLSDFAAAALQFQNDTKKLLNNDKNMFDSNGLSYTDQKKQEDDALAGLMEEQIGIDELNVDDDEDLPDWANEELPPPDVKIISADSKLKTNFLLQALNVKVTADKKDSSENNPGSNNAETKQTGVILPKTSTASNEAALSFSFQFDDASAAPTQTAQGQPAPSQSSTPAPVPAPTAAPTIESTYLSTVNLSDVLGKLLPPPASASSNNNVPTNQPTNLTASPMRQQPLTDEWEYLDPQNEIQGPFPSKNMRRWLETGYFKMDLPIRLRSWSRFYPLGRLYPNLEFAFQQLLPEPGIDQNALENQRRQALLEQQQKQQALLEQQRQHALLEQQRQQQQSLEQQKQQAAMEQQRQQAMLEQQRQQAHLEQQRQQALLDHQRQQAMLEQQRQQQQVMIERQRQQHALLEQQRQQQALLDQQRQQQILLEQQQQQRQRQLAESKPAPWSNTSNPHAGSAKSLAEIQGEEEMKQQQIQQAQSNKLRSLLGMSAGSGTNVDVGNVWNSNEGNTNVTATASAKPTKSLVEIQQEEQQELMRQQQLLFQQQQQYQKRMQQQKAEDEAAAAAKSIPLTWGSAVTTNVSASTQKKSLTDIMKEEQSSQPVREPSSSSWASKAKTLNVAPSSTAPVAASSKQPESTGSDRAKNVAQTSINSHNSRVENKSQPTATEKPVANKPNDSNPSQTVSSAAAKSEFGGKGMTPELAEFCMASMQKLNGSEDITLLEFCMSLKSPAEIREYLAAYLGSKPEVSLFATEFIKRKENGASANSTFSSAVTADKKILKKKK